MKRLLLALAMFAAAPAWAGTTPCTTSSFAGGETVTSAFLNNCTWLGEQFTAEGATADAFEATVGFEDPTDDYTINFPDLPAGTYELAVKEANQTWLGIQSLTTPNLLGKIDANNTAVDDDDCTGEQGKVWYDSTDAAFEFCNANTGAPATVAATSGDVTSVGDCTTADCFTGSSGTLLKSNTDLIMELDDDNNGSESFQIKDGAGNIVAEVDESGNATFDGTVTPGASTTPTVTMDDSDSASETSDATIQTNCTDTGAGTEDCDLTISVQVNSTPTARLTIDADGNTTIPNLLRTVTQSAAVKSPVDTDDFMLFKAPAAITVTAINCIVDPAGTGESVVLTVNEYDGDGDNAAGIDGATTITCGNTNTADDGALSNAAVDSGDWVGVDLGTVTGTVSFMSIQVTYTVAN